jgi:DNA-binding NtrC family response regulator
MFILLVDDEVKSRGVLAKLLRTLGHKVTECSSGQDAIRTFDIGEFHLVITDIRMPHMSGMELLQKIRALPRNQEAEVILFTGYGDMRSAIEALRSGAFDYLVKPINFKELVVAVERVAEHLALKRENRVLSSEFDAAVKAATAETEQKLSLLRESWVKCAGLGPIYFCSDDMVKVVDQARILHQDRSLPVLIEGETGTGKEVVARLIHFGDDGLPAPFVDLNCAALTPNIFETELFGYEAGAFTGGLPKGQKGKLDLALGGTLFLDEMTEMPPEQQAKFLRVLQEKEFYRVGGLKKVKTDVRVVCATNEDIEGRVESGNFRRDLFYRLNAARIYLPPLRQRKAEIIPLAEVFLARYAKAKGKQFTGISRDASRALLSHDWPGNIRELKNLIEYAVVMHDDVQLQLEHIEPLFRNGHHQTAGEDSTLLPANQSLSKYTDSIILEALKQNNGNKTKAANYLGMPIRTFYRHLQRLKETGGNL